MTEDNNNAISKPRGSIFAGKKVGIAAKIDAAKAVFDPTKMENRIGIIFDDSGSMGGTTYISPEAIKKDPSLASKAQVSKIDDAKEGCKEFFKACNLNNTACSLYGFSDHRRYKLSTDIIALSLLPDNFDADQGTPLYTTAESMMKKEDITRMIIFSDGEPTDSGYDQQVYPDQNPTFGSKHNNLVMEAIEKKIPIDTVFIGDSATGEIILKDLSDRTGGLFIKFADSTNFRKHFRYLAPAFRGYLADPNFRKQIGAE